MRDINRCRCGILKLKFAMTLLLSAHVCAHCMKRRIQTCARSPPLCSPTYSGSCGSVKFDQRNYWLKREKRRKKKQKGKKKETCALHLPRERTECASMKPTVYRGAFNLLLIYCDTQNGWQSMQAGWDGMQSGEGVWTYYFFTNCEFSLFEDFLK